MKVIKVKKLWPTPILVLMAALTFFALASFFTQGTLLYYFMENLHYSHAMATGATAGIDFSAALLTMIASPLIDRVTTPWLPFLASLVTTGLRTVLAYWISSSSSSPHELLLMPLLVIMATLDQVCIYLPLWLALDRTVERVTVFQGGNGDPGKKLLNRISGFSYSLMNLPALAFRLCFGVLRNTLTNHADSNAVMQWIGAAAGLFTTVALMVSLLYYPPPPPRLETTAAAERRTFFWSLFKEPGLWRFSGVCVLLLGVSTIFRHLDYTLPVVMQHLFDNTVQFPYVQAINPLVVILASAVIQWRNAQSHSYWVLPLSFFFLKSCTKR